MKGMRTMLFRPVQESARAARQFVRAQLAMQPCDVDTAELLVSELTTNAIGHGCGDVAVSVQVNGTIRVSVHDDDPTPVAATHPGPTAERGRGLVLVDALATQWGVELDPDGKTVWFEL
jgi:serine/threonine-protein kinase RsbW